MLRERRFVLRLVVLEFNVETVLDTDFHLNGVVAIRWHPERMYPNIFLLVHVRHPPRNRDADEIPILQCQKYRLSNAKPN